MTSARRRRTVRRTPRRTARAAGAPAGLVLAAALVALTGCGDGTPTFPTDPDGTLERVRGGELRAGLSPHEPWTALGPDGSPDGVEVALVEDFADALGADVTWTTGGEEALVADLVEGRLDVVVGGFTASTPWTSKAAVTVAYTTVTDEHGKPEGHVVLAPMGENAFLVALERHLLDQEVTAP
jgi:ABC-type amino acid transport substrate-binding protein